MRIRNYLEDFIGLLYPQLCVGCANHLYDGEDLLCTFCRGTLPYTYEYLYPNNKVEKLFWGKVAIDAAASFLYFNKGSKVQHILHQLKYKSRIEVGELMGKLFAHQIISESRFENIDVIIPVPLHPHKLKKRGYNQSDSFGQGLGNVLQVEFNNNILIRNINTETQTRKNRYERFENMESVFSIQFPERITGKNIILVDDVVTTGSTLCSCAEVMHQFKPSTIKIATIASAL